MYKCNWFFNDFQNSLKLPKWSFKTPKGLLRTPKPVPRSRQGLSRRLQERPTTLAKDTPGPRRRLKISPERPKDELGELWHVLKIHENGLFFLYFQALRHRPLILIRLIRFGLSGTAQGISKIRQGAPNDDQARPWRA